MLIQTNRDAVSDCVKFLMKMDIRSHLKSYSDELMLPISDDIRRIGGYVHSFRPHGALYVRINAAYSY